MVMVEQTVDLLDHSGRSLPGLPDLGRHWQGERPSGAAAEADVGDDLLLSEQRDVLQDEANHALALPNRCGRVPPEAGEVGGQGQDLGPLLLIEEKAVSLALAFIVFLSGREGAQLVVPLGFQGVRHQPMVGVDAEEAALGQFGFVASSLKLLATK